MGVFFVDIQKSPQWRELYLPEMLIVTGSKKII